MKTKNKALKIKESSIVSAVNTYLGMLEKQGKILFMRCNSGALKTEKGHWVRFGKAGWPDFICWKRQGGYEEQLSNGTTMCAPALYLKTLFLECKGTKGVQMKDQVAFMEAVKKLGGEYHLIHDVQEVIDLI